ncbi:MAG: hypothetical protein U0J36_12105 [Blautia sp.]|nr:hypothetical protein [Blautia sp.]MEE0040559.1 hypothetical protein [Blautia sp.]
MRIKKLVRCVISLPKSIYFCFRYLPFNQAIRIPILIAYDTSITQMGGGVSINAEKISPAMIHIGMFDGSFDCGRNIRTTLQLQKGSKLIFNGRAAIARGAVINNAGVIEFGNNFSSNFGLFISCSKRIAFGNSCLLGWNNHFLDNNGHVIFDSIGNITSVPKEINIGNNVWITSETHFLSGSAIGDGCVVGYKSFVLRDFSNIEKCLIAGSPSKVLRENIMWKK